MPLIRNKKLIITCIPLFLVAFIDGAGMGLIFPILNSALINVHSSILPISDSITERSILYGATVGIYMLCYFFGSAIISDLSDIIGRKRALFICLLGSTIGFLITGFGIYIQSITIIVIGRIIAGFTAGSQPVAQASIIDICPKKQKTYFIGYVLLSSNLGFILGPILAGILSDHSLFSWFNLSLPMYFAACLSLINLIMLITLYKESFTPIKPIQIKVSRAILIFMSAFNNRSIRHLSLVFFIYILAWSNYYSFMPMFMTYRYNITSSQVSIMMGLMSIGFVIGIGYLGAKITAHLSRQKTIIYSLFLGGILSIVTVLTYSLFLTWILILPTSITASVAYVTILSLYSDKVDPDKQGWIMGISSAILGLGYAVTDFTSSIMVSIAYSMPIILCGLGLLIAGIYMNKK